MTLVHLILRKWFLQSSSQGHVFVFPSLVFNVLSVSQLKLLRPFRYYISAAIAAWMIFYPPFFAAYSANVLASTVTPLLYVCELAAVILAARKVGDFVVAKCHDGERVQIWRSALLAVSVLQLIVAFYLMSYSRFDVTLIVLSLALIVHSVVLDSGVLLSATSIAMMGSIYAFLSHRDDFFWSALSKILSRILVLSLGVIITRFQMIFMTLSFLVESSAVLRYWQSIVLPIFGMAAEYV